jgi:hypothetical protein
MYQQNGFSLPSLKVSWAITLLLLFAAIPAMAQKTFDITAGNKAVTLHFETPDSTVPYLLFGTSTDTVGEAISSDTIGFNTLTLSVVKAHLGSILGKLELEQSQIAEGLTHAEEVYLTLVQSATSTATLGALQTVSANQKGMTACEFETRKKVPGYISPKGGGKDLKLYFAILGLRSLTKDIERAKEINDSIQQLNKAVEMAMAASKGKSEILDSLSEAVQLEATASASAPTLARRKFAKAKARKELKENLADSAATKKRLDELIAEGDELVKRMNHKLGFVASTCNLFIDMKKQKKELKKANEMGYFPTDFDPDTFKLDLLNLSIAFDSEKNDNLDKLVEFFPKHTPNLSTLKQVSDGLEAMLFDLYPKFKVANDYSAVFDGKGSPNSLIKEEFYFDSLDVAKVNVVTEDGYISEVKVKAHYKGDTLEFYLPSPLPIRTDGQQAKMGDHKLICKEDKECSILLGDLLRLSTINAPTNKDLTPRDSTYKITPGSLVKAPVQSINHYLEIKLYGDAIGLFDGSKPNGIVQTEGSLNLPLNSRSFTPSRQGSVATMFPQFHAEVGITKVEENERLLDVQKFETIDSSLIDSFSHPSGRKHYYYQQAGNFVNTFGLLHYSNKRIGVTTTVIDLKSPGGLVTVSITGGGHLYFTSLRDSTVNSVMDIRAGDSLSGPDTTLTRSVTYNNNTAITPSWMLETKLRIRPSSSFHVDLAARGTFLYFNKQGYSAGFGDENGVQMTREQVIKRNKDADEYLDHLYFPRFVFNPYVEAYMHLGPQKSERNNMVYLRGAYFTNFHARNSFFQLQAGYKIDLFTK